MWSYRIESGAVFDNGAKVGVGYSGHADGRNNPKMVAVPMIGPIPPGKYRIGPAYNHDHLGPCTMNLDPLPGTNTFGRSLFRIHGNNAQNDASHGCVILGPDIRRNINASNDRVLEVTE